MDVKTRRGIGMIITVFTIILYIILISIVGNFFVTQPLYIRLPFFAIAGIIWIFPLKPVYMWMRAKEGELPKGEQPPKVSEIKRHK